MGFPKIQRSSHTVAGTAPVLNRIPFYPRGAPSKDFLAEMLHCDKEIRARRALRRSERGKSVSPSQHLSEGDFRGIGGGHVGSDCSAPSQSVGWISF